jgi:glutamate-ammonia-ligase adenylyltransferase
LGRLTEVAGAKPLARLNAAELALLIRVLGASAYLSEILIGRGADWADLFLSQIQTTGKTPAEHLADLEPALRQSQGLAEFVAALRRHKQREYVRIGARDLMRGVELEDTVRELSALAEGTLEAAYRFCRAQVEQEYGALELPGTGRANRFVILGMGKLGGAELNFSSDIDVVFLYESDEGESAGGRKGKVDPRTFFSEIGKRVIHAMGHVTEDGFVFRIDLRLRPLGVNGPLVQSAASAMLYYESWGQSWERAALIKARPVAGQKDLGAEFLKDVEPFVYRRYLDYTTVDELRHMKSRIENELLAGNGKQRNIKLGYGGIREIEFFAQALQLVNGGYVPELREPNTLTALTKLARHQFISARERDRLSRAYRFLRQVEHKVQIVQEAHAHAIPEGKEEEQALARRLGYKRKGKLSERELFWRDHRGYTKMVRTVFDRLFHGAQKEIAGQGASRAGTVWQDLDRRDVIVPELADLGFNEPEHAYENLLSVRDGESYAPPGAKRLEVLRALGPALIAEIAGSGAPDRALLNLARFSHRLGGRTGFLTLLAENPQTMRLLITLFAESQFLTDLFVNRPELIDTLIRGDLTRIRKTRDEMLEELRAAVAEPEDVEDKLSALRRYKTEEFIRIGLHDLGGAIDLAPVMRQLSILAEVCVETALRMALGELEARYGEVPGGRFAVIGGGKLGGLEIDYNSDLDLIFVYHAAEEARTRGGQASLPAHEFYVRLGQRLITYLSAPTEEGIAYKIDMQLRPSGKAGPVVCSAEAYREYHESGAQLWERQALIKTRFIAGDPVLGRQIEKIAEGFAYGAGLSPEGVAEIHHLRMRMERELAGEDSEHFNLKKGRGGLVDIEFLTQMLQLAHGHRLRALRWRGTLKALEKLFEFKILSRADYKLLYDGYLFLRRLDHRLRLERDLSIDAFEADPARLESIARSLYGRREPGKGVRLGRKLLRDYERTREKIRSCYERYFLEATNTRKEALVQESI